MYRAMHKGIHSIPKMFLKSIQTWLDINTKWVRVGVSVLSNIFIILIFKDNFSIWETRSHSLCSPGQSGTLLGAQIQMYRNNSDNPLLLKSSQPRAWTSKSPHAFPSAEVHMSEFAFYSQCKNTARDEHQRNRPFCLIIKKAFQKSARGRRGVMVVGKLMAWQTGCSCRGPRLGDPNLAHNCLELQLQGIDQTLSSKLYKQAPDSEEEAVWGASHQRSGILVSALPLCYVCSPCWCLETVSQRVTPGQPQTLPSSCSFSQCWVTRIFQNTILKATTDVELTQPRNVSQPHPLIFQLEVSHNLENSFQSSQANGRSLPLIYIFF